MKIHHRFSGSKITEASTRQEWTEKEPDEREGAGLMDYYLNKGSGNKNEEEEEERNKKIFHQ